MVLVKYGTAVLRRSRALSSSVAEHWVWLSLGTRHLFELFLDFLLLGQTERAGSPLEWELKGGLLH